MKPVLGLAVNNLGHVFIIAQFPIVTKPHAFLWQKRDLAPAQPSPYP